MGAFGGGMIAKFIACRGDPRGRPNRPQGGAYPCDDVFPRRSVSSGDREGRPYKQWQGIIAKFIAYRGDREGSPLHAMAAHHPSRVTNSFMPSEAPLRMTWMGREVGACTSAGSMRKSRLPGLL